MTGTPWDGPRKAASPSACAWLTAEPVQTSPRAHPATTVLQTSGQQALSRSVQQPQRQLSRQKLLEAQPSHVRAGAGERGRPCLQSGPIGQHEGLETFPSQPAEPSTPESSAPRVGTDGAHKHGEAVQKGMRRQAQMGGTWKGAQTAWVGMRRRVQMAGEGFGVTCQGVQMGEGYGDVEAGTDGWGVLVPGKRRAGRRAWRQRPELRQENVPVLGAHTSLCEHFQQNLLSSHRTQGRNGADPAQIWRQCAASSDRGGQATRTQ